VLVGGALCHVTAACVMIGCSVTTLLLDTGGLCSYLEDVLSVKQHPLSSRAIFCVSLLIHSTASLSLSVSNRFSKLLNIFTPFLRFS